MVSSGLVVYELLQDHVPELRFEMSAQIGNSDDSVRELHIDGFAVREVLIVGVDPVPFHRLTELAVGEGDLRWHDQRVVRRVV